MKRVLVTGAAGTLGLQVIKYLLSEGKYEITGVDLKTKYNVRRLRGYRKRINIIYSDLGDQGLVDNLIKNHDYVIYLSGVSPVYINYKSDLGKIDSDALGLVIQAIKNKNPKCFMLYASSTSVYGIKNGIVNTKTKIKVNKFDDYSKIKLQGEQSVSKLKNYAIFRLGYVLVDPKVKSSFYTIPSSTVIESIGLLDAAYAFVGGIGQSSKINKTIFNVTGGENFRMVYAEYLLTVFKTYGLSFKYLKNLLFAEKNYYSPCCDDSEKLEDIIHFRHKGINSYYNALSKYNSDIKRIIPRVIGLPFQLFYKRKGKNGE